LNGEGASAIVNGSWMVVLLASLAMLPRSLAPGKAAMILAGVVFLASMLPPPAGEPAPVVPHAIARPAPASRPLNPAFAIEGAPATTTPSTTPGGWPMPLKLLLAEGSIAAMSSCGYISEAVGEPPRSGAYVLGSSLVGVGAFGALFIPWALADANTEEQREGTYLMAIACAAVVAAGGYNLYLNNNHDPTSAQIFRDNMIALNAVPLVTWTAGRIFHWRF